MRPRSASPSPSYRALGEERSLDRAVTEARRAIYFAHEGGEWGTPVFYTSSDERRLFPPRTLVDRLRGLAVRRPLAAVVSALILLGLGAGFPAAQMRDPWPPSPECPSPPGLGLRFRKIDKGSFEMGGNRNGERPEHHVEVGESFCIGQFEVTQRQWHQVTSGVVDLPRDRDDEQPANNITWDEVQGFLVGLNRLDGKGHYRQPMESQWEYAARAGSPDPYSFGKNPALLRFYGNCGKERTGELAPVGKLSPNRLGLFDMSGNVREWVADDYLGDAKGPAALAPGTVAGTWKVVRGGGFKSGFEKCKAPVRDWAPPRQRSPDLGFRIVRDPI